MTCDRGHAGLDRVAPRHEGRGDRQRPAHALVDARGGPAAPGAGQRGSGRRGGVAARGRAAAAKRGAVDRRRSGIPHRERDHVPGRLADEPLHGAGGARALHRRRGRTTCAGARRAAAAASGAYAPMAIDARDEPVCDRRRAAAGAGQRSRSRSICRPGPTYADGDGTAAHRRPLDQRARSSRFAAGGGDQRVVREAAFPWSNARSAGACATTAAGRRRRRRPRPRSSASCPTCGSSAMAEAEAPQMYVPHAQRAVDVHQLLRPHRRRSARGVRQPAGRRARGRSANGRSSGCARSMSWSTRSTADRRALSALLALAAVVALLISAIGVYGVTAATTAARKRELAIRAAIGADRGGLMRLVVRQGMAAALVGVVRRNRRRHSPRRACSNRCCSRSKPRDPITYGAVGAGPARGVLRWRPISLPDGHLPSARPSP